MQFPWYPNFFWRSFVVCVAPASHRRSVVWRPSVVWRLSVVWHPSVALRPDVACRPTVVCRPSVAWRPSPGVPVAVVWATTFPRLGTAAYARQVFQPGDPSTNGEPNSAERGATQKHSEGDK